MNFLTRVRWLAQTAIQKIAPGVCQVEASGGCAVDADGVRKTCLTVSHMARRNRNWDDVCECEAPSGAVGDYILEAWEAAGIPGLEGVKIQIQDKPAAKKEERWGFPSMETVEAGSSTGYQNLGKQVKSADHWRVHLWLPCPDPIVLKEQADLDAILNVQAYQLALHKDKCTVDKRFALGEELRCGGGVYNGHSTKHLRGQRCWYVCTVPNDKGNPAHVIVRGSNRWRWRTTVGRTLYAVKWCLFDESYYPG